MAEVVLFHHAQGLTPGVVAFADELRRAGHTVHTPDLFEGHTFATIQEGMGYAEQIGFPGEVIARGLRAVEALPAGLVYASLSARATSTPPASSSARPRTASCSSTPATSTISPTDHCRHMTRMPPPCAGARLPQHAISERRVLTKKAEQTWDRADQLVAADDLLAVGRWFPSRGSKLVLESDVAPAAWIEPLLFEDWCEVRMTVPQGFEAYARIFFPFVGDDLVKDGQIPDGTIPRPI